LRFFAGLTEVEIARELDISERTVRNQWNHAKAWLRRELA
jgi:DNA-binding CsgD family transcriptional regulator